MNIIDITTDFLILLNSINNTNIHFVMENYQLPNSCWNKILTSSNINFKSNTLVDGIQDNVSKGN